MQNTNNKFDIYKTSISETRSFLTYIRQLYLNHKLYEKNTLQNKSFSVQAYCLAVLLKLHSK